ncbi:anti-anti-sigma factor [Actinocorallia herbida]|uniref:Anti-anti-sigma factor n=2 Tax=Actinocorallia herbida TaxID=58109 RepID=A0A3N1CXD7_9ACTN|nr:anti-anti-sigma factor [Actinocorallia herbida]
MARWAGAVGTDGNRVPAGPSAALPRGIGADGVRVRTALLRMDGTFDPGSLRVDGRVEHSTAELFARAVAAVVEGSAGSVRIDLGRVDFIDLAGLRSLIAAARRLAARDCGLILRSVAPHLMELMRLVGWEGLPGLTLVARHPACAG